VSPEERKTWKANPRRWDNGVLMALPTDARVAERGIVARRTETGIAWWISFQAPIAPGAKRKKQKYERVEGCRTKSEAAGALALRKAEVFQGTYKPRVMERDITLDALADEAFNAKRHLKTAAKYRSHYDNHVRRLIGGSTSVLAITRPQAVAFYAKLLDEGHAIASANYYFTTLRTMLAHALDAGYIAANPCARVKLKKPNNRRERVLTDEETARLLVAARRRTDHVRPLYVLLHDTGMRLGEALHLEWADVVFEKAGSELVAAVRVRESKNEEGRWVQVAAGTAAELARWKAQLEAMTTRKRDPRPMSTWVFPARIGDGHTTEIKKGWKAMCEAAGVAIGRHELRHNFVSQALAAGHAPVDIMPITGHKTLKAFEGYAHSQAARRRAVAESVASVKILRSHCADKNGKTPRNSKRPTG
jgi:integrase